MAEMMGVSALNLALNELMKADPKVVCVGEDIGAMGGTWTYFKNLEKTFGRNRVMQTPICEAGYTAFGTGLAYGGYRPVVEYMFADFATLASDGIVNTAAKARYNSAGTLSLPITFIFPEGAGKSGCQHSQVVQGWFANIPGLKLVAPTTPADLRYFLKASVIDDDPVCFFLSRPCAMSITEEVDAEDQTVPTLTNAAKIVKAGADLTVVAWHTSLLHVKAVAAEAEAETGKSIEIIDPRVLCPFDTEKVFASVRKTGRLLICNEACERGSFASHISAWVAENCLTDLKAPVVRVGSPNSCIPFGAVERFALPQKEDIKAAMLKLL